MNVANFLPIRLASLTVLVIALPNLKAESPQPQPAVAQSGIAQQDAHREADLFEIASPRRLTVTVKVSEPQELKVQEGSVVKKR